MNKSIIKEVKSVYSNKIRANNSVSMNPEIISNKNKVKKEKTFFNGVIEKLNISSFPRCTK